MQPNFYDKAQAYRVADPESTQPIHDPFTSNAFKKSRTP